MVEQSNLIQTIEHYFIIDKYDRVIELGREALEENYRDRKLWYMLGYSNYQLEHYAEAEEQLIEAMNLGFDKEIVFYMLGHLYMDTKRWKESEDAFLETLRINPNNAEAHAGYAKLMRKTGHRKKSKELLKKAIELDPMNGYVLRLYFQMEVVNNKDHSERFQVLEKYLESGDSEISKHIQLGLHASFRGKMKEAREHYREAYLLNPENKELLEILEDMEVNAHPLLAPNRLMGRIGGPVGFWLLFMVLISIFALLKQYQLVIWFGTFYFIFCIYTWISIPLVLIIRKIRR